MGTKWRDMPLSEYIIHAIASNEGGYNYYLYIHPANGDAIIMREKTDLTEYRYASAAYRTDQWANRASLGYITYDQLA